MNEHDANLTVYGAPWCPDCRRAKQFLGEHRVAYQWVDVDADPAGVFVFIGLRPNTAFLQGIVTLDESGFIVTDAGLQTSMPGLFAAGDARVGSTKQVAAAAGEGAAAALAIRTYLQRFGEEGPAMHEPSDMAAD